MATSRPNVVVFVPDQLRADCVGAFGNPIVRTPNIDALAARGARFDNAIVQHPVCSPSRASFLTGWYPHVAGHRALNHLLQPGEPNSLKTFKRNGYHVVWAGARGDTFAPGYYGMISRMDAHVGRVMAAVEASGAAQNTITAFFADHGEYLGDYGLIEKWPSAMSGNITRDPLILAGPGIPAGCAVPDMVEIIDVFPTLLDLADVSDDTHRHYGCSLTEVLNHAGTHRTYAFTEGGFTVEEEPQLERPPFPYDLKGELQHRDPRLVGKAIAVRDQRYTYVERLYEPPELYDRGADPTERVNLAGRPEYTEVQQRLRDAVLRWLHETADVIPYEEDPRFPDVTLPTPAIPTP